MLSVALTSSWVLGACGSDPAASTSSGTPSSTTSGSVTTTGTPETTGSVGTTTGAGPTTSASGTDSSTASSTTATATTQGAGGTGSTTGGTDTGTATGTTGGEAPAMLSQTGLFTERSADGTLVLAEGVREFQPRYWLWSDGSDKKRYVYLPPGTQIDTSDPDHWVLPVGTKLWKSFISGEQRNQLVETRLIERIGEGEHDFRYATYFWMAADSTDAMLMKYNNERLNAAGTTHDIPSGPMCERCHNGLKERALGFSALQLNHDLGGLNLASLLEEGLLTEPISLDIGMPGDDELTRDALGYLHANCGNCHNDSPGLPVESVPAPQMFLRVLVGDLTVEDTGTYKTAVNQLTTASSELGIDYRIYGGDDTLSALYFRMTRRMIEDQMPPIGTEVTDDEGLSVIQEWISDLPPPVQ